MNSICTIYKLYRYDIQTIQVQYTNYIGTIYKLYRYNMQTIQVRYMNYIGMIYKLYRYNIRTIQVLFRCVCTIQTHLAVYFGFRFAYQVTEILIISIFKKVIKVATRQKSPNFGLLFKKICCPDHSNIAQSGRTEQHCAVGKTVLAL